MGALCGRGVCAHLRWPRKVTLSLGEEGGLSEWPMGRRWQRGQEPRPGLRAHWAHVALSRHQCPLKMTHPAQQMRKQVSCLKRPSSAFCYFFPEMKALVTVLDIHRALHYCLVMTPGFHEIQKRLSPLTGHLRRVKTPPCTTWLRTKGSGELCGALRRVPTALSSFCLPCALSQILES